MPSNTVEVVDEMSIPLVLGPNNGPRLRAGWCSSGPAGSPLRRARFGALVIGPTIRPEAETQGLGDARSGAHLKVRFFSPLNEALRWQNLYVTKVRLDPPRLILTEDFSFCKYRKKRKAPIILASLGYFFAHLSYSLTTARLASSFFMLGSARPMLLTTLRHPPLLLRTCQIAVEGERVAI